ncbi:MAG TPA: UDP-N-acetylglucosamine 2-epimerase (non-hydrolyzing) [Gaiellaceae bacterium]
MERRRVMVIFGTRPEAIKVAPVIAELERSPHFDPIVVVTGQHREMLAQVLDLFGIVPHYDLDLCAPGQTLASVTTGALDGLTPLLEAERPDAVLVQGDTTTTFVGGLAAFYQQIPVVHLEAGLRTGNPYSPFPEEVNRALTTRLATLHLAPTEGNKQNLLAENIKPESIIVTGNTVVDALLLATELPGGYGDPALDDLDADPRRVVLVTAHRRESWGEGHAAVGRAIAEIARTEPDVLVVFPIHRNPVVRDTILPAFEGLDNVRVIEPLGYRGLVQLMQRADLIVTDSGGIQEEGPSLGKPVLVMRDTTERPEAVTAGTVRLVGTDEQQIVGAVRTVLHDPREYASMANAINPYGDGRAAERTVAALAHLFDLGPRPEEFLPELPEVAIA